MPERTPAHSRADLYGDILERLPSLGDIELELVADVVRRIHAGQTTYGLLAEGDPRDWKREADAELTDAVIYTALDARARQRRG
jgi:hypothetical protein